MSVETAVQQLTEQVTGNTQQTDQPQDTPVASQEAPQAPKDPDEWYDSLDDGVRAVVDAYSVKLQNALKEERQQRKAFEKQIKELSAKATGDDGLKSKLDELGSQLSEANLKAAFYEAAADVANLPAKRYAAAYKIAKLDGMIDEDGVVDWKALQDTHDYLFTSATQQETTRGKGSAGAGLTQQPQPKRGMNDLIRGAR